jgi:hypothetical protein
MKIFQDQKWQEDTIELYLACLGRLYFPINTIDKWGIIPVNVGVSNTGKSTVLECVVKSLKREQVVTIGTNEKFCLFGKNDKELVYIGEAENIHKGISAENFKSIARGEMTLTEGKNRDDKSEIWKTPIAACSNKVLNYEDKSGGIENRSVSFCSDHIIDPDPAIKETIHNLVPKLVPLFLIYYHKYAKQKFQPSAQMVDWSNEIAEDKDLFKQWLSSPNENLYTQIVFKEGQSLSLGKLNGAWGKHYRFTLSKQGEAPKLTRNEFALLEVQGMKKIQTHICKFCLDYHKKDCCGKYHRTSRTTGVCFMNCALVSGGMKKRRALNDEEEVG